MAFHSKRLRNNPKGSHGPIPPKLRARRPPNGAQAPSVPPVPEPCRCEESASRNLAGGADSAGENKLGRRHARSVYGYNLICPKGPCGMVFRLKIQFADPRRVLTRLRGKVYLPPHPPSALDPPIFRRLLQTTPSDTFSPF